VRPWRATSFFLVSAPRKHGPTLSPPPPPLPFDPLLKLSDRRVTGFFPSRPTLRELFNFPSCIPFPLQLFLPGFSVFQGAGGSASATVRFLSPPPKVFFFPSPLPPKWPMRTHNPPPKPKNQKPPTFSPRASLFPPRHTANCKTRPVPSLPSPFPFSPRDVRNWRSSPPFLCASFRSFAIMNPPGTFPFLPPFPYVDIAEYLFSPPLLFPFRLFFFLRGRFLPLATAPPSFPLSFSTAEKAIVLSPFSFFFLPFLAFFRRTACQRSDSIVRPLLSSPQEIGKQYRRWTPFLFPPPFPFSSFLIGHNGGPAPLFFPIDWNH